MLALNSKLSMQLLMFGYEEVFGEDGSKWILVLIHEGDCMAVDLNKELRGLVQHNVFGVLFPDEFDVGEAVEGDLSFVYHDVCCEINV